MVKSKEIIAKVYLNRSNQQKLVTIPKKRTDIKPGSYVKISKVRIEDVN